MTSAKDTAAPDKDKTAANAAVEKGKAALGESTGKSKGKKVDADTKSTFLSQFRPRPRISVFFVFAAICASICFFYDTCDVRKKKQDCGYSGISPNQCRTMACFTKGGGEMDKKKITLKRSKGTKFGIKSGSGKDDKNFFIQTIKEGAIADHNARVDPEDRLYERDSIVSIDGKSGSGLTKALKDTNTESVVIEIRRSQLPSFLRWIHRSSKPNLLEKVLTAPGSKAWFEAYTKLGGLGIGLWFISGYSPASLPIYYLGMSAATAWHLNRCCHDSDVQPGVPHCYKGGSANFSVAVTRLQTKGKNLFAKIQKDPRSYLKWLFLMPDLDKLLK